MVATARRAKEIFVDLIRLPSEQRQELLESACEGDEPLRLRVRSLLEAHQKEDSFLLRPADPGVATVDTLPPERIGTQIGPYKLLEQIGEGGMGVVYVAEQTAAGPAAGGAQDHQAGHGHASRSSPASRPSGRRWR